jgi:hypothetical protein
MNPRQRVEVALHGEIADRVPFTVYECMLPQCAVERDLRNRGLCIVERRVPVVHAWRPNVSGETRSYSVDGVGYVRSDLHTPVGDLSTVSRPAGFTSWTVERLFKRPDDYRALAFYAGDLRFAPCYDEFLRAEADLGEDIILRGGIALSPLHEIMTGWMGHEAFAVEWSERRDEVLKLHDIMVGRLRELYPLLADSPCGHFNYGGNEVPEVMGRHRLAAYVLPRWEEAAEALHAKGKLLGVHLDGNSHGWADLIAASPLDYIEAFTPPPDCDMSVAAARRLWPGKVLWINFPSSVHLRPAADIEAAAHAILEEAAPGDGFLLGITEDVPRHRWQDSFQALMRATEASAR